jgi:hypothetical protein
VSEQKGFHPKEAGGMSKITIWSKFDMRKKNYREHNHIENGWNIDDKPVAINEIQQKAWEQTGWTKKHGFLIDGKVKEAG